MFAWPNEALEWAEMGPFIIEQRKILFLCYPAVTLSSSRVRPEWPRSPWKYSVQVTPWWLFDILVWQMKVRGIAKGARFTQVNLR